MSAISAEHQTALTLTERAAIALGDNANAAKLQLLAEQSKNITVVNSPDGREEAHRAAMVLRTTRTNITNTGKAAREDATAFGKAVIAMEKSLIAIIEPEEERVVSLRDKWDAGVAAERAAKIAAERARVDAIADRIAALREDEADAIRIDKTAAQTRATLEFSLSRGVTKELFEERYEEAATIHAAVVSSIRVILAQREADELAAAEAETARLAEIERIAAERAELAKLRAEADERERAAIAAAAVVAAEHAATAKRLADAEAELQRKRDQDAAAARAAQLEVERMAKVEADKVAAQRAKEAQELADERAALAREQAEFKRKQDEVAAAEAKVKQDAIDAETASKQAEQDAIDTAARQAELQAAADQLLIDGRERQADERVSGMPAGSLGVDALLDAADADTEEMDDSEFVRKVADALGMTIRGTVNRMSLVDFDAARTLAEAA